MHPTSLGFDAECNDVVTVRVLPRHIRLQNAYSIDLTYSEQELDQECDPPCAPTHLVAVSAIAGRGHTPTYHRRKGCQEPLAAVPSRYSTASRTPVLCAA